MTSSPGNHGTGDLSLPALASGDEGLQHFMARGLYQALQGLEAGLRHVQLPSSVLTDFYTPKPRDPAVRSNWSFTFIHTEREEGHWLL